METLGWGKRPQGSPREDPFFPPLGGAKEKGYSLGAQKGVSVGVPPLEVFAQGWGKSAGDFFTQTWGSFVPAKYGERPLGSGEKRASRKAGGLRLEEQGVLWRAVHAPWGGKAGLRPPGGKPLVGGGPKIPGRKSRGNMPPPML